MSYATLMVHVDPDDELSGRVGVAADLAGLFDAHLIGIAGWEPMRLFLDDDEADEPGPDNPHLQDMKALMDQKGEQFRAAMRNRGLQADWRSFLDLPTEVVVREARAGDLVSSATDETPPIRSVLLIPRACF